MLQNTTSLYHLQAHSFKRNVVTYVEQVILMLDFHHYRQAEKIVNADFQNQTELHTHTSKSSIIIIKYIYQCPLLRKGMRIISFRKLRDDRPATYAFNEVLDFLLFVILVLVNYLCF